MKHKQNITNKHNLPEEIYRALCSDRYSGDVDGKKTDYSATSLVSPIQQTILKKRYPHANSEDAIDRVWSMYGSVVHSLLEEHGSDESFTEQRLYSKVLGKTISGQVDHYKEGIVTDYKTTTAYKVIKKDYSDWERQLNIYAWLFKQHNFKVRSLRIIAIIRDWKESETYKSDYPQIPIEIIPITLWDDNKLESFVKDRVATLKVCEDYTDDQLPECTKDDMWETPTVWAVMKEGRKSAIKLHNSKEDAENHASNMSDEAGNSIYIQERRGERRRCAKYCNVSSVCAQYKKFLEETGS